MSGVEKILKTWPGKNLPYKDLSLRKLTNETAKKTEKAVEETISHPAGINLLNQTGANAYNTVQTLLNCIKEARNFDIKA